MSGISKIIPHISSRNFGTVSAALYSGKYNRSYFTYTQELSQPLDRKPDFVTAKEAFEKCLKSGMLNALLLTILFANDDQLHMIILPITSLKRDMQ